MDARGEWKMPVKVLEQSYHMSYPFIFEFRGTYYMIPETHEKKTVELYRCTSFPFHWTLDRILLDNLEATDTTVAEIDGLWWMFTSVIIDDELRVYYSRNPLEGWKPHEKNPVKLDVRSSRPAGNLFKRDGQVYRPAQDGSKMYAYAISINKLMRLTPEEFEEQEVDKILPDWDPYNQRTHTINHVGNLTVIDGFRHRSTIA